MQAPFATKMQVVTYGFPIGAVSAEIATADGTPAFMLAMQYPEQQPGFEARMPQDVLERFHLERFRADYVLRFHEAPFELAEPGRNPPDFVVRTADGEDGIGLDCAAFALERWRTAYRLFLHFMNRVQTANDDVDLSGLVGCQVGIVFDPTDGRPPRRSDDSIIEPLLRAMDGQAIDYEAVRQHSAEIAATQGLPEHFPPGMMATGATPDGTAWFFAQLTTDPSSPGIPLDGPVGYFLNMSEFLTVHDLLAELQRLVDDHDQPTIEHLVVSAGAPDQDGLRFPGEEMAAAFLLDRYDGGLVAEHIRRVTIHLWASGTVVDVPLAPRR